jgi:lysophospholipase L1-like esterase
MIIWLIGTSIIKKWKHFTLGLPDETIINLGVGGIHTSTLLTNKYIRILTLALQNLTPDSVFRSKIITSQNNPPDLILFYAGGVDVRRGTSNHTLENIEECIAYLQDMFPDAVIVLLSIMTKALPSGSEERKKAKAINKALADLPNIYFIDINKKLHKDEYYKEDKIHLTEEGYTKLNELILLHLRNL